MQLRRLSLLALPLVFVIAACGGASGNAATFNNIAISNAQFERELNALKNNKPLTDAQKQSGIEIATNGKVNPDLAAQWLASDIEQVPVDQEFEKRKLTISADALKTARANAESQLAGASGGTGSSVLDAFPKWFQDLLVGRQARVEALLQSFVKQDGFATDAAWAAANGAAIAQACPSGKVVSHILVKTKDQADAVRTRLASGADFAAVAKETSTDPGSKDRGGFLGCVANGQFVAPFESAMNALAPGATSDPVQTEYGFHVIRVDEVTAPSAAAFVARLRQQAAGKQFTDWLTKQMADAKITVAPKWGTASTTGGQFNITPPTTQPATTKPASTATTAPASTTTSH